MTFTTIMLLVGAALSYLVVGSLCAAVFDRFQQDPNNRDVAQTALVMALWPLVLIGYSMVVFPYVLTFKKLNKPKVPKAKVPKAKVV